MRLEVLGIIAIIGFISLIFGYLILSGEKSVAMPENISSTITPTTISDLYGLKKIPSAVIYLVIGIFIVIGFLVLGVALQRLKVVG